MTDADEHTDDRLLGRPRMRDVSGERAAYLDRRLRRVLLGFASGSKHCSGPTPGRLPLPGRTADRTGLVDRARFEPPPAPECPVVIGPRL